MLSIVIYLMKKLQKIRETQVILNTTKISWKYLNAKVQYLLSSTDNFQKETRRKKI